jgi:hypothetical protein
MEKLFSDSETLSKHRPTKITSEQEQEYYKKIAEDIINEKWSDSDLEDIISDISEISIHDSGYEIAKDLESYNKNASYNIDTDFITYLDDIGYDKHRILVKNVEAWVMAHNPQPKFNIGQKLIIKEKISFKLEKGSIVFVNGYVEKRACYYIHANNKKTLGIIIPYETVESDCEPI